MIHTKFFRKIFEMKNIVILIFLMGIISTNLLCSNNKNYNKYNENFQNFNQNNFINLENQNLDENNNYEGIGSAWNATHWANRTDIGLSTSFSNGSYGIIDIPMDNNWEGYRLDANIYNIYDSRNWCNGTFNYGTDDGTYGVSENDTIDIQNSFQNWTFYARDITTIATNRMSGNYINSGSRDYLELAMENGSEYIAGYWWWSYDAGDKCMWNSTFHIERGRVIDCILNFDVNPAKIVDLNVFALSIYINNIKIYSIGTFELENEIGANTWGHKSIPMFKWSNQTNVFSNAPINNSDISISIALEALGSNMRGFSDRERQIIYIDNIELIVKAEVKPNQIGLKLNNTDVNTVNWGIGYLNYNPSIHWKGNIAKINFSATDPVVLGNYTVHLKMDSIFYIYKTTLETTYETNIASLGAKFSIINNSKIEWLLYDYIQVPDGYIEQYFTLNFQKDINITGVYEPQFPSVNILSQCNIGIRGEIKVPVVNISSTPDGFWKFTALSPNYIKAVNIFENKSGGWVKNKTILSGRMVNIRANITISNSYEDISSYINNTYAKLIIKFPNGSIWTERTEVKSCDNNGFINFTVFQIPNINNPKYIAGEYNIIIIWNNTYNSGALNETGLIITKFIVIHQSTLKPDQDKYYFENIIENSIINLKVSFYDSINNEPITDAAVYTYNLPYPSGLRLNFSEISPGYYFLEFNISGASLGNNTLTINAKSPYFIDKEINITIYVIRETELNVKEYPLAQVYWNENITIHLNYTERKSGQGINGTISYNWNGQNQLIRIASGIYNITLNTSKYAVNEIHSFTINATKIGYQTQSITIKIEIKERLTFLDNIFLNGVNQTENKTITLTSGMLLNITVQYKDTLLSGNYLRNADVRISGNGLNKSLQDNSIFTFYNITLNTTELDIGANFLTIKAKKNNYTIATTTITVIINARATYYRLYLNGANYTDGHLFKIDINQEINVTIEYRDSLTKRHISNANITLVDIGKLEENLTNENYNLTINSNILGQGVNLLTILCEKEGYESISIKFSIEVLKRETSLTLWINGINKTSEPSIDVIFGEVINLSISYIDNKTKEFINGAIISITGKGINQNFTEYSGLERYQILLDSSNLNIGITFLTIFAQRNNYQEITILLRVNVERIKCLVNLESGGSSIRAELGKKVEIKIILTEEISGKKIEGANVTYTWELGEGTFKEIGDGVYSITLENIPLGNYIITVSISAGDEYEFNRFEISLNVVKPQEETLLYQILSIGFTIAAIGLVGYLIAYQKVLKYPKPVRKIRKFKKHFKKKKEGIITEVISREDGIKTEYSKYLGKINKDIKARVGQSKEIDITKENAISKKSINNNDGGEIKK
ncbi:MAG: hypothetical protein ACP6IY_14185 [Promethearchaeia archaeon]